MPVPPKTSGYYSAGNLQAHNSVGYLTKRCGILGMQMAERAFQSQPITFTQWIVLAELLEYPHQTPTELSSHLGHDMGALTRIVDDLQEKQFVRRERPEQDRRAVQIAITPAGRRIAAMTESVVLRHANEIVEIYSKSETDLLISLLQRLVVHMENSTQPGVKPAAISRRTVGRSRKPRA